MFQSFTLSRIILLSILWIAIISCHRNFTPKFESISKEISFIDTSWDLKTSSLRLKVLTKPEFPNYDIPDSLKPSNLLFCLKRRSSDSLYFINCNNIGDLTSFYSIDSIKTQNIFFELNEYNTAIAFNMFPGKALFIFNTRNNQIKLVPMIDKSGIHQYLFAEKEIFFDKKSFKFYTTYEWKYWRGNLYMTYLYKNDSLVFLKETNSDYK